MHLLLFVTLVWVTSAGAVLLRCAIPGQVVGGSFGRQRPGGPVQQTEAAGRPFPQQDCFPDPRTGGRKAAVHLLGGSHQSGHAADAAQAEHQAVEEDA